MEPVDLKFTMFKEVKTSYKNLRVRDGTDTI